MIAEWFTTHPKASYEWFGQTSQTLAKIEQQGVTWLPQLLGRGDGPQGNDGPEGQQVQTGPFGQQKIGRSKTQWQRLIFTR